MIAMKDMSVGQPSIAGIRSEMVMPSRIPIMPPVRLSTMDSIRNCVRTADERAPIAMRMPISRVRSVTDTSMMFMMPMPPTSSETLAMLPSRMVIMRLVSSAVSATSVMLRTLKSLSWFGPSLCRWRSRSVICSWAL
ncbi:MAG: hypothetical protein JMDDDDMK_04870 [Acidobacteria bacterium]|nr:hypothetical protein [Acidobacteriota bacterium]